MKVVILAGGYGTRISEESHLRPKPMIEIGEKPILWHIMKSYSYYGFNDFIICLGYKSNIIKEYFSHYYLYNSDITFDFTNKSEAFIHQHKAEPWKVTLVDTGLETLTGGRLKRIADFVGDETFMMTYGDGLSSIDITSLLAFHHSHGKLATVTVTQPPGRFGAMQLNDQHMVEAFREKPKGDNSWINAGFFVLEPQVFKYIDGDHTVFEKEPLENISRDGQLMGYQFEDFWHPMDTLRDKNYLEQLWKSGNAPWKK
ncbi:glucose-1-phosphate cytidylyltransferase [Paenibacillus wynnii]|uniref:glucose-1-phosphate cytidylyltransferase n=1 Tax=Paenibacillus wynnii TaxID=268407 RepID=UPI002790A3F4|nr:glucose-1-phosphate cytidylyltransferase [Paenibacillus wynnii]MDQ0194556.1 glucose-1-phosphate cytidylyltransferase [Paenibacillus wynnii]